MRHSSYYCVSETSSAAVHWRLTLNSICYLLSKCNIVVVSCLKGFCFLLYSVTIHTYDIRCIIYSDTTNKQTWIYWFHLFKENLSVPHVAWLSVTFLCTFKVRILINSTSQNFTLNSAVFILKNASAYVTDTQIEMIPATKGMTTLLSRNSCAWTITESYCGRKHAA